MSPQVLAAIIAGALTVIGTLAAQYFGRRATQKTLEEQGKQLDRTLAEQRTRTLNERFSTAASQLGGDKPPAVQLAGVYAMAVLADDWKENRQFCVDVLCGYLRIPYEPDPGEEAPAEKRRAFLAIREVRHSVIRVITAHLIDGAATSWQNLNFDFTSVMFDGGDFSGAVFFGSAVSFINAVFSGGTVSFADATFSGGVSFHDATFSGGTVSFNRAEFSGSEVNFGTANFTGATVQFNSAQFAGGTVDFSGAQFAGGTVWFAGAQFAGGTVRFRYANFSGGTVWFAGAQFADGTVDFERARFSGSTIRFNRATFSGGTVDFNHAKFTDGYIGLSFTKFTGSTVQFYRAEFSGTRFDFIGDYGAAKFTGGTVDFSQPADWSHRPKFPWQIPSPLWDATQPPSVKLPENKDQSQA
jgi:uncharacterized protein YjbI with pentapeptide repeats